MIDCWGNGVNRWHANKWPALRNSGDTTDAHSNRMAKMALHLWGEDASRELLAAIAFHDDSEGGPGGSGDVPGPIGGTSLGHAVKEHQILQEEGRGTVYLLRELSNTDAVRLRFLDRLDAYRWVALVEPRALADDGWPECKRWLTVETWCLGVRDKVPQWL